MIEVRKNRYKATKAYVKDLNEIGDFLLIGITSTDFIVFTEYYKGLISSQLGYNVEFLREKGVAIENLNIEDFNNHECYETFAKNIKIYGKHEFLEEIMVIPYVGICFKVEDDLKARYFDSSLGASVLFVSEYNKVQKVQLATEFFYLNYSKVRDNIIELLYKQYKFFKEEVLDWELDEEEMLEMPDIEISEEVRKLIEFTTITVYDLADEFKYEIGGNCSWDPEHGFSFRVNQKLEVEEIH